MQPEIDLTTHDPAPGGHALPEINEQHAYSSLPYATDDEAIGPAAAPRRPRRDRTARTLVVVGVLAVLAMAAVVLAVVVTRDDTPGAPADRPSGSVSTAPPSSAPGARPEDGYKLEPAAGGRVAITSADGAVRFTLPARPQASTTSDGGTEVSVDAGGGSTLSVSWRTLTPGSNVDLARFAMMVELRQRWSGQAELGDGTPANGGTAYDTTIAGADRQARLRLVQSGSRLVVVAHEGPAAAWTDPAVKEQFDRVVESLGVTG